MLLKPIDWAIIATFFAFTLVVGLIVSRRAGASRSDFFLSGRGMPWWLLGSSMVATTFAADTPLLVTSIVREHGVAGNWQWWAFLLTGMLTVAVYAKLWRRSGIVTDVEFYELRYGGKAAAFLRAFRAAYLGILYNVMIMATVSLAAMKIGQIMFNFSPLQSLVIAAGITVVFSAFGGLTSVLVTDFVLFIIAMIGSIGAAVVALRQPEVGGLAGLFAHPAVQDKLSLWPAFDLSTTEGLNLAMTIGIMPLAVQWWASWYPGAEPGGGGYVVQRMLAAKDEAHATGATLFFNAAHYALRPWPWIIVALASLIIFPTVESIGEAFPLVDKGIVRHDLAYPAMLGRLPPGLLGLLTTSLLAAYMSTISTQLNWGASYVSNDLWLRFIRPKASERELVWVGRLMTVVLMILAGLLALELRSVYEGFQILLKVGAGTGMIFLLRWFWWRINAMTEIVAMMVSFALAGGFFIAGRAGPDGAAPPWLPSEWAQTLIIVGATTIAWVATALLTAPDDDATLRRFYERIRPGGPGWRPMIERAHAEGVLLGGDRRWNLARELAFAAAGCVAIYAALFATGLFLYGRVGSGLAAAGLAAAASLILVRCWRGVASGTADADASAKEA